MWISPCKRGEADFFSAKRLFFRAARDVSGVRSNPPWARVEIKLKKFSGFIPLTVPRKGFSPHIPASRLFILFHPSKAPSHKAHHTTINQNEFVKWGQSQRFFSPFFYTFVTPFVCIFTELFILLSHKMPNEVRPLI